MSPAPKPSGTAPREAKPQNKPLYSDQKRGIAVFPDFVTNPESKETTEYFVYVEGKAENAIRIGRIPTKIGGYELQNDQQKGYSDVVDLVDGKELTRPGYPANGGAEYVQIIAPLGIDDVERKNDPSKTDKRLQLYVATAYLRKETPFDKEGRPNVESFNIHSKAAEAEEAGKRDLKCWRHIPIDGSINPRTKGPRWFELRVSDALKARDAIAAGEKYSFEHNGTLVTCEGIEAPQQEAGAETKWNPVLKFSAKQLDLKNEQYYSRGGRANGQRSGNFSNRGGGGHDGNTVPDPSLFALPEGQSAGAKPAQGRH